MFFLCNPVIPISAHNKLPRMQTATSSRSASKLAAELEFLDVVVV